MDKYFLIRYTDYEEWVEEFETKRDLLDKINKIESGIKYGNAYKIIKGKELNLIKNDKSLKYDLND